MTIARVVGMAVEEIEIDGLCMGCGAFGMLGNPCGNTVCARFDLHFVPHNQSALELDRGDSMLGRRVDEFLLVRLIGKGGFGRVYRALYGGEFEQEAAIKFLQLPDDERIREAMPGKFALEAQVLQSLDHPNIVGLIAHRTDGDMPYIAMEYLPRSVTLREDIIGKLRAGEWYTEKQMRGILVQILDALEAAHDQGVVHRDVKPENVMLQYGSSSVPRVKLVDFGTAKILAETGGVTQMALGSPSYMAPEQFELENIGTWTDVYATAVVAFELFGEKKPFPGDDDRAILKAKFDPKFDPFGQVDIAPDLEAVLRRAMCENFEHRFRDAGEFREALLQVLDLPQGVGLLFESEVEVSETEETRVADYVSQTRSYPVMTRSDGRIPTPTPYSLERESADLSAFRSDVTGDERRSGDDESPPFTGIYMEESTADVLPPDGGTDEAAEDPVSERPQPRRTRQTTALGVPAPRARKAAVGKLIPESRIWRAISLMLAMLSLTLVWAWSRSGGTRVEVVQASNGPTTAVAAASEDRTVQERRARLAGLDHHLCMTDELGRIACGGSPGLFGGDTEDHFLWSEMSSPVRDIAVSADDSERRSACLLLADGNVRCWGYNADGRLGYGHVKSVEFADVSGSSGFANVPTRRPGVALAMSGGTSPTTCVALDDRTVRCWRGAARPGVVPPNHEEYSLGSTPAGLVASNSEFCIRSEIGTVSCWEAEAMPPDPKPVSLKHAAVALVAGDDHFCILDDGGGVSCWGDNDKTQLGAPSAASKTAPIPVGLPGPVKQLAAGSDHTCALLERGVVRCWGSNSFGQLGLRVEPRPAGVPADQSDFVDLPGPTVAIAAGRDFSCARQQDGQLICWGKSGAHAARANKLGRLEAMDESTSHARRTTTTAHLLGSP